MRGDLRLHAFLVAMLTTALPASADFRPRVIISWESRDTGAVTTSRLRQDVDLFLSRAITESITLQMTLGANHYNLATGPTTPGGAAVPDSGALELRPSGNLRAAFGPLSTESSWALRRSRFEVGETTSRRDQEQLGTRASWSATRFSPGGSVRAWRSRIDDRSGGRELVNDLVTASLDYQLGGLTLGAGQSYRVDRDSRAGYERTTGDSTGTLAFNDTYAGGKLSVTATANGARTHIGDETSGDAARIPNQVHPSRAFWGVDDTPLESIDRPLSAVPSLIDGRTSVSTGIDLGPGGASFQAIAFDIGRISPVDEIQIVVRDEGLDPVTTPAGIDWDVYTSLDGERWTPHAEELSTAFDGARSQYDISFRQIDVRWIKVVTFGVAAQPVFVTEGVLLFHTVRSGAAQDSNFGTLASTASLSYTPVRSVTVGYTGASYRTSQKSGDALQSDVDDRSHQLSVRFDPGRKLGYEARYEIHEVETDRSFQSARYLTGSMRYTPRAQLSATLLCDVRHDETEVLSLEGRMCTVNTTARIYPTLDLTAGVSARQQQLETGGTQVSRAFYASSTARLTRSLRTTVSASLNRSRYDDWTGALPPPPRDDRYTADFDWHGGRAIGIGATLGWVESSGFSGLVQRYRVRWSPFGDGSVSLMTNYTQDVDPYSNSRSQRLLISPRWQINPKAALNLTYSSVSTTGESRFESDSLIASLILGR